MLLFDFYNGFTIGDDFARFIVYLTISEEIFYPAILTGAIAEPGINGRESDCFNDHHIAIVPFYGDIDCCVIPVFVFHGHRFCSVMDLELRRNYQIRTRFTTEIVDNFCLEHFDVDSCDTVSIG